MSDIITKVDDYGMGEYREDYFHPANNNRFYKESILIKGCKKWKKEYYDNHESITVPNRVAFSKLGHPNFVDEEYDWMLYWILDYKDDTFYYQNNIHEGSSIGIWVGILTEKSDPRTIALTIEDKCQMDYSLTLKLLDFERELSNLLNN